ncbi:hypothetical protein MTP99_019571 [Tenebrio molitor]|nr:hypothetical protein MTP99_019571 [Tenebrio molitor]
MICKRPTTLPYSCALTMFSPLERLPVHQPPDPEFRNLNRITLIHHIILETDSPTATIHLCRTVPPQNNPAPTHTQYNSLRRCVLNLHLFNGILFAK